MSTFAPPIIRSQFIYNSILYADAGNGNLHPRATVAELADLLRPDSRSSQADSGKQKDQVGHWYTAQLIHYGLPPTKNKNAAKVRLLNALNSFKLEVPGWIFKVEGEMKREWDRENRKVKKGSGKVEGKTVEKAKGARKSNNDVNVTVNVSLSSGLSMLEQLGLLSTPKSSPGPSPVKRKRGDTSELTINRNVKQAKTMTPKGKAASGQTKSAHISNTPVKPAPNSSRPIQTARQTIKPKLEPSPRKPTGIKREKQSSTPAPYIKPDPSPEAEQGSILLSGTYDISCPTVESLFPNDSPFFLTVHRDHARNLWWARFIWGDWHCCIRMDPGPEYSWIGTPCTIGWRIRDLDTGILRFGRGCTGEMTFYLDQRVHGVLYGVRGVGDVEFWGPRNRWSEVQQGKERADEFMEEWNGFVGEAYGR